MMAMSSIMRRGAHASPMHGAVHPRGVRVEGGAADQGSTYERSNAVACTNESCPASDN